MQWIQDPDSEIANFGMVNSYLHAAVEYGIPVFMIFLFAIIYPILMAQKYVHQCAIESKIVISAASAALFGFSTTCLFSSLWIIPSVMWAPLVLIFVIVEFITNPNYLLDINSIIISSAISLCSGIILYLVSVLISCTDNWHIIREESGAVTFLNRRSQKGHVLTLDKTVF